MILVTGATGFTGRHVVPALLARGCRVRAAVRAPAGSAPPDGASTVAVGDIGPDTDWSQALEGVTDVIHLAGLAHVLDPGAAGDAGPYFRVNTEGTVALGRAAAAAGVRRLVFASSVKVYGDDTSGRLLRESDPTPATDPYGASKRQAEAALAEMARPGGLSVVALRLPLVHGPGVRANLLRLFEWVDRGVPLPLGRVHNRRSLLSVANLAHAIALALAPPATVPGLSATGFDVFNVADDEVVATPDLVRRIAAALDRPARLVPVPVSALRLAARVLGRTADVDRLVGDLAIDTTAIRTRLGYTPVETLDAGLAAIAHWYRSTRPAAAD
jgi:nucleoside-diphosphate-sugar epimerase